MALRLWPKRRCGSRCDSCEAGAYDGETVPVCIDLRRRQAGVAEHLLNRAQIGAMNQHVGCEGVTEDVRRDPGPDGVASWIARNRGPVAESRSAFQLPLRESFDMSRFCKGWSKSRCFKTGGEKLIFTNGSVGP
jgi:hypothetical protein